MGNQTEENDDKPPIPGGDPEQRNDDVLERPRTQDSDEKGDKSGYGHIGNKEVPRPAGSPPPHQIF